MPLGEIAASAFPSNSDGISADTKEIEDPGPEPAVVAQILEMADQAKKEPSFVLPFYVVNMLNDKQLMSKVAPDYDLGDLLDRYGLGDLPKAA